MSKFEWNTLLTKYENMLDEYGSVDATPGPLLQKVLAHIQEGQDNSWFPTDFTPDGLSEFYFAPYDGVKVDGAYASWMMFEAVTNLEIARKVGLV